MESVGSGKVVKTTSPSASESVTAMRSVQPSAAYCDQVAPANSGAVWQALQAAPPLM
jgi:hypothetical protein